MMTLLRDHLQTHPFVETRAKCGKSWYLCKPNRVQTPGFARALIVTTPLYPILHSTAYRCRSTSHTAPAPTAWSHAADLTRDCTA
jgi:hypothetical protein